MKVLHKDPHGQEVRLVPETLDDLWHLSHLISKGDLVTAWTFRTKDLKDDKIRGEKVSKVRVELQIRVEEIEFALFADRLRVRGPIVGGAQDMGSYHTLTFEADGQQDLKIWKDAGLKPHHWDRLNEAVAAAKRPLVTILCIDDEEATIAVLRQSGVQPYANIRGPPGGKMYRTEASTDEYFGETLGALKRARPANSPLVVVGPGFTRESFLDFVRKRDPEWVGQLVTEGTGQSGMTGVQEALKRGIVERIQKDQQVAADTMLVEEIFAEIAKDGAVGYGAPEVEALLNAGAVRLLVLSDELLRTAIGEGLLDLARRSNAKSHIVATTHEAGKKLQGLGGAAALLRYKPA
jgi:protein pelota